jgi:DNA-binding FadR family transcriptional regulator
MSDRNESFGSVMQIREELTDAIIASNAKPARDVMVHHVAGFQTSLTI